MQISGLSGHSVAQNAGVTFNRQHQVDQLNAKTGAHYDLKKEVAAANAQTVVDLLA